MVHEMQPLVTIAIPTYNRADNYLKQSLNSALCQTYPNIEIIVSDNCSTDCTETVVTALADSRIRYFRQSKNIGAPNNAQFCLQQAQGKYILMLHDDDLIDPDFIDACMAAVKHTGDVGIIHTGARTINSQGKVLAKKPNVMEGAPIDAFFRAWFAGKTSPPYLCSTLFHTQKLRDIGGLQSKYYLFNDAMAAVQLAAMYGRVDVKDIKASFRRHDFALTYVRLTCTAEVAHWCDDSLLLLDVMCKLVSENKTLVRREGMRFFFNLNYRRAQAIKSPFMCFICYLIVFKKFSFRYLSLFVYYPIYCTRHLPHFLSQRAFYRRILAYYK